LCQSSDSASTAAGFNPLLEASYLKLLQQQQQQKVQQHAWSDSLSHGAAAASNASTIGIAASGSNALELLDVIPSADWMLLQQHKQNVAAAAAAAAAAVDTDATAALSAAIAAAAAAAHVPALPDSLLNFPASRVQPQQQPMRGAPEYIPVVAPPRTMSSFRSPAQHAAAAAAQAAAAARAAAISSRPLEVVLDLHPVAFALVASSLDAVEKLSGAVLRIVERGALPLGLRIMGRQEHMEAACELIRSLTMC
jgi:hypothetical protein